jgi:hypothetical protein
LDAPIHDGVCEPAASRHAVHQDAEVVRHRKPLRRKIERLAANVLQAEGAELGLHPFVGPRLRLGARDTSPHDVAGVTPSVRDGDNLLDDVLDVLAVDFLVGLLGRRQRRADVDVVGIHGRPIGGHALVGSVIERGDL